MTEPELAAARAYLRLLKTARAALADPGREPVALPLLTAPMAETDAALTALGMAGNEAEFFRLVATLRPGPSPADRGAA
ncbi:hypothetical protein ABZ705_24925 [Streptomyces sp. NPDC006984]|uniref:hypothetical protein n=1 Tax=Streptomyces sp. NPDC006984 TaxID=3155463 RepID=UPI0033F0EA78